MRLQISTLNSLQGPPPDPDMQLQAAGPSLHVPVWGQTATCNYRRGLYTCFPPTPFFIKTYTGPGGGKQV